jgi:hypothetical protein
MFWRIGEPYNLHELHLFLKFPIFQRNRVYRFTFRALVYYSHQFNVTFYISEPSYSRMNTIRILAISAILAAAILSMAGFTVMSSVVAQEMTGDNATMSGNMTGGNVTEGNTSESSGTVSDMGDTLID